MVKNEGVNDLPLLFALSFFAKNGRLLSRKHLVWSSFCSSLILSGLVSSGKRVEQHIIKGAWKKGVNQKWKPVPKNPVILLVTSVFVCKCSSWHFMTAKRLKKSRKKDFDTFRSIGTFDCFLKLSKDRCSFFGTLFDDGENDHFCVVTPPAS